MSKYGGVVYGSDTYGERVRGDLELKIQNTGYWTEGGRLFAKFRINLGGALADYPPGSRVIIARGSSWYPDLPGKFGSLPAADAGRVDNDVTTLFSGTLDDDRRISGGWRTITERDVLPRVPINSVLYLRVFVQEPPVTSGEDTVYLPWDVRGSAFAVMAGVYGGYDAAIGAVPLTHYTDGDPYGILDPNSVTAKFVASLGFLADSVFTDGALMVDGPSRLHPNMVWPLLAGFGMTTQERAAFSDSHLFGRLKNLLFAYRRMQASRGIAGNDRDGLAELARALTGYDVTVLSTPENLLSTLGDSMPANLRRNSYGQMIGAGIEATGAWGPVCVLPIPTGDVLPPWGDLWVSLGVVDTWGDTWDDGLGDVWLDDWNQLGLPAGVTRPGPPIADSVDDPWFDDGYTRHTDWVHMLTGPGSIGTRTTGTGLPETATCERIDRRDVWRDPDVDTYDDNTGHSFRLRFRVIGSGSVTPKIVFTDDDGAVTTYSGTAVSATSSWQDVVFTHALPFEPGWLSWRVDKTGSGTAFIGAIELRRVGEDVTSDPLLPSAWLLPYRNPRSVVVGLHTRWINVDPVPSGFDDTDVLVDDPGVLVSQYAGSAIGELIANDVLSARKLTEIMPDYLPHSVSARVLPAWTLEYQYRFPERATP